MWWFYYYVELMVLLLRSCVQESRRVMLGKIRINLFGRTRLPIIVYITLRKLDSVMLSADDIISYTGWKKNSDCIAHPPKC